MNRLDMQAPGEALLILDDLREVKRNGYLRRGVPQELCESTAGHTLHGVQAAHFFTGNQ